MRSGDLPAGSVRGASSKRLGTAAPGSGLDRVPIAGYAFLFRPQFRSAALAGHLAGGLETRCWGDKPAVPWSGGVGGWRLVLWPGFQEGKDGGAGRGGWAAVPGRRWRGPRPGRFAAWEGGPGGRPRSPWQGAGSPWVLLIF